MGQEKADPGEHEASTRSIYKLAEIVADHVTACRAFGSVRRPLSRPCSMLSTYAVSEIVKSWCHNGRRPGIYYYRDKDRREIDVLLEENGVLYPMEIRKKSNPGSGDIWAFDVIENVLRRKRDHGAVLCMAQTYLPITADADAVPIGYV